MAPDSNEGDLLRLAVLSDVHGNLPAFRAVLDDVSGHEPDAVWFLGDLVGGLADAEQEYGPLPSVVLSVGSTAASRFME